MIPPLHARFLGAMYLSGATFMVGGMLARSYAEVRIMVRVILIWTGMLFLVSLFYLGEFDYSRQQVWIWFGAYVIYPLIALLLIWRHRALREAVAGRPVPGWARGYLLVQGVAVTALALLLLLAPDAMVGVWPWKITRLLAQIYAAPFLAYGLSSAWISRLPTWPELRVVLLGTLVFAAGVLLASLIHRNLFAATDLSDWVWFAGFTVATAMLGVLSISAVRGGVRA